MTNLEKLKELFPGGKWKKLSGKVNWFEDTYTEKNINIDTTHLKNWEVFKAHFGITNVIAPFGFWEAEYKND